MFNPVPVLKQRFFDANGDPLAGGKLWTYIAGTTTPSSTYQDSTGGTPNTNPIVLNADGECDVYISSGGGSYKFVLMDASDVVQWTVDNISPSSVDTPTGWTVYAVTDGQTATGLTGQTLDLTLYSSAFYDVEILRGTTVLSSGQIAIQNVNGTARVETGMFLASEAHGITFSITQAASVAQLLAAASAGPGNGTIKVSRRLVPV